MWSYAVPPKSSIKSIQHGEKLTVYAHNVAFHRAVQHPLRRGFCTLIAGSAGNLGNAGSAGNLGNAGSAGNLGNIVVKMHQHALKLLYVCDVVYCF